MIVENNIPIRNSRSNVSLIFPDYVFEMLSIKVRSSAFKIIIFDFTVKIIVNSQVGISHLIIITTSDGCHSWKSIIIIISINNFSFLLNYLSPSLSFICNFPINKKRVNSMISSHSVDSSTNSSCKFLINVLIDLIWISFNSASSYISISFSFLHVFHTWKYWKHLLRSLFRITPSTTI